MDLKARLQDDRRSVSGVTSTHTGSSDTQTSLSSSNPDLARVFVRLADGTRIVVPVPQNSTVGELHSRTLKRAQRWLGPNSNTDDTFLETTGNNPVILFGEDALVDVLDLTDDSTFSLGSLDNTVRPAIATKGTPTAPAQDPQTSSPSVPSQVSSPSSSSHKNTTKVYVRWITLEAALENSRLRRIPVDRNPISCHTTLKDFHQIARERLSTSARSGSCSNPHQLNLYLRECRLHAENNWATLSDLGIKGSKHEALDVFVDFNGGHESISLSKLSSSADLQSLLCFDSTNRGLSTFVVSIQMLLKEIDDGHCTLDGVLEVLLELTHFPPLLLAFRDIHETGVDDSIPAAPLLLVASAFHALCARMVPSKICQSSGSFLEASRQVVCWIYSMRSEASLSRGSSKPLVHRAQIKTAAENSHYTPMFMPFNEVDFTMGPDYVPEKKRIVVSIEIDDKALCQKLGTAIHEKCGSPWDFYFQPVDDWITLWDHKISPLLHPNEFENLIESTNSINAFKMVGPLQIGACLAAELPVIILGETGYVSRYDHEDLECSDRKFISWNPIDGKKTLRDNPGQFLSQKLDPILLERKKTDNWKLDAWPTQTKTTDFGTPDEAIVICVDTSSSMNCTMPDGWLPNRSATGTNPSRLTEVKEFFKNLSLRISALNLSTHLGLVTFSDKSRVTVKQALTPLHLNFNHQLDNISALGSTAIFDAMNRASSMLIDLKGRYPTTKCRIILLTDGEDNVSSILPQNVSTLLYDNNIVLDAVVIGSSETRQLFRIARHTGGYAFAPRTQQGLFQIFLLETVVDIRTRPDLSRVPWTNWETFMPKDPDMANQYDFPPCRPHPNLNDYFVALGDAERFMNRMSRRSARSSASVSTPSVSTRFSVASTVTVGAGGSSRILLSEIKAMIDNPHDFIDVYVSQSNMGFWKVVMQGPPDSPYANGTFLLYIEIGAEFPRRPPSARFITPMLHPNITKHGRVCHPIFDREWTPATRVFQVLQHLYGILMSLEARDAIDPLSALRFWSDEAEGQREVENYVNRFARRSRALHRLDIISDDISSVASSSVVSSSASSTASRSTVTSPQNPFNNPPSYRSSASSSPSVSGVSTRTTSTASTLYSHLQNQRRPPQAQTHYPGYHAQAQSPPLMARTGGQNQSQIQASSAANARVGPDGRNRLLRNSSASLSGSVVGGSESQNGGNENGSEAGSVAGGRRVSRRASFFARLRGAGT